MKCSDLSRCYYPHWGRLAWAVCLRSLVGLFKVCRKLKPPKNAGSLLGICKFVGWIWSSKKCWSVKLTKILVCLLVPLAVLLLSWGCSTSQSSQFSAHSTPTQPSLLSHPQKTKNPSQSHGDSSSSQAEQILQQPLQQDTSLWSQSPLWEQSSDSTSLLEGEKDRIDIDLDLMSF